MSDSYEKLFRQGRAKAIGQPWSEKELEVLCHIAQTKGHAFSEVAPYIRNGVMSLEDYEKALNKGVEPVSDVKSEELVKKEFASKMAEKPKVLKVERKKK